jgi:hypothetical protein
MSNISRALLRASVAAAATCAVVALGLTLTGPAASAAQQRPPTSRPTVVGGTAAPAAQPHTITSPPTVPGGSAAAGRQPHALTSPPTVLASTWQPTTTHDSTSSHSFYNEAVSCATSTFCMSVGYDNANGVAFGEEWNGTAWNEVPVATPAGASSTYLDGVSCVNTTFCEAVGEFETEPGHIETNVAETWNGSSWTVQTIAAPAGSSTSVLESVSCTSLTFCFATGWQAMGSSAYIPLTQQWNGSSWSYVAAGNQSSGELNGVSCSSTTFCAGVGDYYDGSTDTLLLENWNGSAWVTAPSSSTPTAAPFNYLTSVSCTGPGFCAATGSGYTPNSNDITQFNSYVTLMEIWNGSSWSVTPSPNFGGPGLGNYMYGVSCVAATSCAAVGSYYTNSSNLDTYQNEAFTWNGATWAMATPADYAYSSPEAGMQGVSCISDWACMSVGYATNASNEFSYNTMSPMARSGYRFVASDGGVFNYGKGAPFLGSLGATHLNAPIVGVGIMPAGDGYYLVASDGGVFAYGSAQFYGSMGGKPLNKPIVGMAVTPDGGGYWLVASDGGVFAFGDAQFFGSAGSLPLNKPVVGLASAPNGRGYWIVASDGGIFNYGPAAPFLGSTGGTTLNKPVVGIGATTSGQYYLVASDGGIFAFPTGPSGPPFYGSTGSLKLNKPIIGMTTVQGGYYLSGSDGGVFAFPTGTNGLPFYGSTGGTKLNAPIVGVAS